MIYRPTQQLSRRGFMAAGLGGAALLSLPKGALAQPTPEDVFNDPDGPVLGNPNGDVTIVEYFDYQCPYCKANHPDLMDVVQTDGNIKLLMKDWPIFGAPSVKAAQLALGAHPAGVYEPAHHALMKTEGRLDDAKINAALESAGVDPKVVDAAYRDNRSALDGFLSRNGQQAAAFGFPGTPAFIIGTVLYPGGMDKPALLNAVRTARA